MTQEKSLLTKAFGTEIVRILSNGDEVLFVAKDVCETLGFRNPRQAVASHCKGVKKMDVPTSSGIQSVAMIPESDIYRLVMRSKLPEAEKFQDWVCKDVLPEIRKTGSYEKPKSTSEVITPTGDPILDMLRLMAVQREEVLDINDRLKAIESGSIPLGWNTIGELSRQSGLSENKTKALISAFGVKSKKIPQSGEMRITHVTVADEDGFFSALKEVKNTMSVSNSSDYYNHPKLGRFTIKETEAAM